MKGVLAMPAKERVTKHNYYLDIAETVAERSTCLRKKYGAIIVKNDVIISTGYNGAPRGRINCSDLGECLRDKLNIPSTIRFTPARESRLPDRQRKSTTSLTETEKSIFPASIRHLLSLIFTDRFRTISQIMKSRFCSSGYDVYIVSTPRGTYQIIIHHFY